MSKTQIYRLFLALVGILGVSLQIQKDGWGMLLYYTVLSNILVFSFLLYLVSYEKIKGPINDNPRLLNIKAGVTMAITITFIVYHFLLAPLVEPQDYWNLRNFIVHYIVPIGMILDTLFLDSTKGYSKWSPLLWTAAPLLYFAFALINGLILKLPIPGASDSPFAYFFINVNKFGWSQVLLNTLLISLIYTIFGYLLMAIKKILPHT